MDRRDDLGVVDALQVNGRDAEVAVPELALDDNQRREPPPDARNDSGPP
jgi:hypothetical protein